MSNPEQYEKFDHLVRALGRDGLLDPTADPELVRRESPSYIPPSQAPLSTIRQDTKRG